MTGPRELKAHGLSFSYGRQSVLSGVSFSLGVGAHVLLGRNGAGKTTLIRLLAGAATAADGTIRLGEDLLDLRTRSGRALLRHVGWLPQDFGYPPHMKVADFVSYAAWLKEVPNARLASRVEAALEAADMIEHARRPLSALSGGQLRRAGLAAATVAEPEVLILDEPTAGLDPEQRDGFHGLIRELRKTKVVVIATHLLEDVEALAEHVVVIDAGAILWTGTADELASTTDGPGGLQGLRRGFRAVLGTTQ